jgi:hypothetical protein
MAKAKAKHKPTVKKLAVKKAKAKTAASPQRAAKGKLQTIVSRASPAANLQLVKAARKTKTKSVNTT